MKRFLLCLLLGVASLALWAVWPDWFGDLDKETVRIVELLDVGANAVVADIGAGDGRIAVRLARRLDGAPRVIATDVDHENLLQIQREVADLGLENVVVRHAGESSTGLSDSCCDAVLMRKVFHHIKDREGFAKDLARIVKPGGKVMLIEFGPRWYLPVAGSAEGHGIRSTEAIQHLTAAGLTLDAHVENWPDRTYLLLFEKPL